MRTILCFSLTFVALASCDKIADRTAIENVIGTLNESKNWIATKSASRLITSDAHVELERLLALTRRMMELSKQPWSEVTNPRIAIQSIRFVTPGVALADAAITQYGSVILARRIPILFVMKKERTHWRIASVRLLVDPSTWLSDSGSVYIKD